MELVIAYALTILVTIALIVLGSHRKYIKKNRGTSGGALSNNRGEHLTKIGVSHFYYD